MNKGGNQHGNWVTCLDCNSRWKIPMASTDKLKPKAAAKKEKEEVKVKEELAGPASSAAERFSLQQMEQQIRQSVAKEHQAQYADALKMMTSAVNEKSAQAEQIKTLRTELLETQRSLRVTSLMTERWPLDRTIKSTRAITMRRCGSMQKRGWRTWRRFVSATKC